MIAFLAGSSLIIVRFMDRIRRDRRPGVSLPRQRDVETLYGNRLKRRFKRTLEAFARSGGQLEHKSHNNACFRFFDALWEFGKRLRQIGFVTFDFTASQSLIRASPLPRPQFGFRLCLLANASGKYDARSSRSVRAA
jgi:hypothetical protein